jgi:hypothetical protein
VVSVSVLLGPCYFLIVWAFENRVLREDLKGGDNLGDVDIDMGIL